MDLSKFDKKKAPIFWAPKRGLSAHATIAGAAGSSCPRISLDKLGTTERFFLAPTHEIISLMNWSGSPTGCRRQADTQRPGWAHPT
ncbi:MAG: hypothetical protein JSS31_03885 [Proteobacteria bacterium]|nr:hypothetical protein [Pseudomonadota bacterium]